MIRLLFISPYFFPATAYGGPIASASSLCRALAAKKIEVRVVTTDANGAGRIRPSAAWCATWPGVQVHYSWRVLWELWAPGQAWQVLRWARWADVIYVWGAFFWALALLSWAGSVLRRPVIVSPRGMLLDQALGGKAFKKGLFLSLVAPLRRPLFELHATSEDEAEALRRRWPSAEVATIPNGVDVPMRNDLPAAGHADSGVSRYVLYLGRLDPHKQVERIIAALAWCAGKETLRVAGEGDARYVASLRQLAQDLGVGDRVRFLGYVGGEEKSELLAHAAALVLASRSENFGMSVAEALAHGTPCVVSKSAPWAGLERERCGLWVDGSVEALATGMKRLLDLPEQERVAMGERGRAWMVRAFSWDSVADNMISFFATAQRHAGWRRP